MPLVEYEERNSSIRQLIMDIIPKNKQNIHIFFSDKNKREVDTIPIINYLQKKNHNIFLPRVKSFSNINQNIKCLMTHHKYNIGDELIKSNMGILEPSAESMQVKENIFDIVICPLLCFDRHGYRLGYGGGCYDRFLSKCSRNVKIIGVSLFRPLEEKLPINEYDIPLHKCVTYERVFTFLT